MNKHAHHPHEPLVRPSRRGITLIEMTMSIAIVSTIIFSLGSSMFIGIQTVDAGDGIVTKSTKTTKTLDTISSDLLTSLEITQFTEHLIEMRVPDRDEDEVDETILYSWSGVTGDPLYKKVNDGEQVIVAEDVHYLDFSGLTRTVDAQPIVYQFTAATYSVNSTSWGTIDVSLLDFTPADDSSGDDDPPLGAMLRR